jgi:hypothetical protein
MLVSVLHFLTEHDDPYRVVDRLLGALPVGSYLVISHGTFDYMPPKEIAVAQATDPRVRPRSRDEVARFFDGLELVPPGLVPTSQWRVEHEFEPRPAAAEVAMYGGIGRVDGSHR